METIGDLKDKDLVEVVSSNNYINDFAETTTLKSKDGKLKFSWKKDIEIWLHTGHAFGFIQPSPPGDNKLKITHAGNINPDKSLVNTPINIFLETLRVADYPGNGVHNVVFDFSAQNCHPEGKETLHFNQIYRVQEGESAGIKGYPIFFGLNPGKEGVSFVCKTVNADNENEKEWVDFLDSEVFSGGLQLLNTVQPAIAPLTAMATNIMKMLAKKNKDKAVQNFNIGLNFSSGLGGIKLREGLYIAVQIPDTFEVKWNWDEWVYDQTNGHIVNKAKPTLLIPYNYVVFNICKSELN